MQRPSRHAFTIVELLIVIAVIILLLSILTVAISAATRASQRASTTALMASMKQGLSRFRTDIGYLPPVLGGNGGAATPDELRRIIQPPDRAGANFDFELQAWYSEISLAEYLLGYGTHEQDGHGRVAGAPAIRDWEDETPPLGIRHPGRDGVWGSTFNGTQSGILADRMLLGTVRGSEPAPHDIDQGKVYGPYLELKDDKLLASVDGTADGNGNLRLSFPGEGNYDDNDPKVIVDYWGRPIRYYRRIYPLGALQSNYRSFNPAVFTPTIAEVILLRPFRVPPGSAVDSFISDLGANNDPTTSMELRTADFAIFSAGPDRTFNAEIRADGEEFNKDNIVEVGP